MDVGSVAGSELMILAAAAAALAKLSRLSLGSKMQPSRLFETSANPFVLSPSPLTSQSTVVLVLVLVRTQTPPLLCRS